MQDGRGTRREPARSARADRHAGRQHGDVSCDDEPRLRGGFDLPRAARACRRRQGRLGPDSRRRARRHDRGAGAAASRLPGSGAGIQQPRRAAATGRCAAATISPSSAASARSANSSRDFISIRGRGGFRITIAPCSITASASMSRSSRSSRLNHNAFLHASGAFGGQPQRIRDIKADFHGQIAELLAKVTAAGRARSSRVGAKTRRSCSQALRSWGALDENYAYEPASPRRMCAALPSVPAAASARRRCPVNRSAFPNILQSRLWRFLQNFRLALIADHDVPAGRRHGHDRQGVRARSRRPHSL